MEEREMSVEREPGVGERGNSKEMNRMMKKDKTNNQITNTSIRNEKKNVYENETKNVISNTTHSPFCLSSIIIKRK